jgi:hypothetical protein
MQEWFITLCVVVFLLSIANTYIQAKRRAFILTCLGSTGILFCLSFLIAAISLPRDKTFNNLSRGELIVCYTTGITLAIQTMALLSIVFALSIELYVTFRIKNRAIRDSLILKSVIIFFCCLQPTLFVTLNIVLMIIDNIQIVDIVEEGGWCNVRIGGNRWGVLFVRALPLWFTSIPGALVACRYRPKKYCTKTIKIWVQFFFFMKIKLKKKNYATFYNIIIQFNLKCSFNILILKAR